jgi:hypothetical protein
MNLTVDLSSVCYRGISHTDKRQVRPSYTEKDYHKRHAHEHPLQEADFAQLWKEQLSLTDKDGVGRGSGDRPHPADARRVGDAQHQDRAKAALSLMLSY